MPSAPSAPSARALPLVLALALGSAGCPSSGHRIPRSEFVALSQLPPEQRGARVRVIQGLGGEDDPPAAPRAQVGVGVYVGGPVWIGGVPHHHRYQQPSAASGVRDNRSLPAASRFGGSRGGVAAASKDSARAWLVVAAVAAGALALTEGLRYDGWVRLHPMHPVHLWGPYGEYTWMPLAEVTPEVAGWSRKAVVRPEEGPWEPLGRAPLDRQGFTYSLLVGGGEIALIGDDPRPGFLGHIQLGFYPLHILGLQADIAYGWAEDDAGATVFDGRYSLELDVMPLSAGIFHAGGYGQLGLAYRSDDGIQFNDRSGLLGGGAQLQLELTTRLALTLRAGLVAAHDDLLSELTFGLSIY